MTKKPNFLKAFKKATLVLAASLLLFQCSEDEILNTPQDEVINTEEDAVVSAAAAAACSTCTYVVPATQQLIDGKVLGIKPGDVICLNAAFKYKNLTFQNIVGTVDAPVIITNCGGTVTINTPDVPYSIRTLSSKYFRITGGNVSKTYGIRLTGSKTNGLSLGTFSTNFEVDHIEVYSVGFAGIMAKTDPTCDDATIRGNFTMRDISLHDNYIHHTGGEGFYIGHTSYNGVNKTCGLRLPHTIEGAKIFNNIVKYSGWDAIQLSSATKGAEVYNNIVENYSTSKTPDQMGGILIGGGTGGSCYGNYIKGGFGAGLVVFGLTDNLIHNNMIVNPSTMGIFCDERTTPLSGFKFLNNTIINPGTEGIRIYSENVQMNVFVNNIIVNPGTFATYGQSAYVMRLKNAPTDMANNIFVRSVNDVKFVDPATFNFKLQSTSPAVNKGRDISAHNIPLDFYKTTRLKGAAYDIGASEY